MLAIVSEGSFAKAARTLFISQPALTRSIQEMERKTGLRLFERGREGATATDACRMLIVHAELVNNAAQDLQREINMIRGGVKGELRIGLGLYAQDLFLGPSLGDLTAISAFEESNAYIFLVARHAA